MSVTLVGSDHGDAAFEATLLAGMRDNNAFKLLEQVFELELKRLDQKIFDTERTTPEVREQLVHARRQITENFAPRRLVNNRLKWLQARVEEKTAKSA